MDRDLEKGITQIINKITINLPLFLIQNFLILQVHQQVQTSFY